MSDTTIDPTIKYNEVLSTYLEILNTGTSTKTLDRSYLEDLASYRMFEALCIVQAKLELTTKQDFYKTIEDYLDLFGTIEDEESIVAIESIIDSLNQYCSKSQLKKFQAKLKSTKLKNKIKSE